MRSPDCIYRRAREKTQALGVHPAEPFSSAGEARGMDAGRTGALDARHRRSARAFEREAVCDIDLGRVEIDRHAARRSCAEKRAQTAVFARQHDHGERSGSRAGLAALGVWSYAPVSEARLAQRASLGLLPRHRRGTSPGHASLAACDDRSVCWMWRQLAGAGDCSVVSIQGFRAGSRGIDGIRHAGCDASTLRFRHGSA